MSGFLTAKRTIGFRLESSAYTAEDLTSGANAFGLSAYDVSYDVDVPSKDQKLTRGDFSKDPAVAGKRSVTISFKTDIAYSGTLQTPPQYFVCLQACGLKQIIYGTTGVELLTDAAYSNVPATIEVIEKDEGTSPSQLVVKAAGCMGNAKFVLSSVGTPIAIEFSFKGRLVSVTDRAFASIMTPTGFSITQPDAVLGVTTTIFSESAKYDKITIDLGNDVQLFTNPADASGYEGARVVGRDPKLEIDPDLMLRATNDSYTRHINNTTGAFSLMTSKFTISAPKAQFEQTMKVGDREGHVVHNMKFGLKRNLGNDELSILQGSRS